MASGLDEVDTGMDPVVNDVCAVDLVLGLEEGIVSLLNVLHNWAPGVIVVDKVSKAGSIDNGQAKTDAVLLNIGTGRLDRHSLGDDIVAWASTFLRGVKGGIEEGVHKSRLSQSRFTCSESISMYLEKSDA